MAANIDLKTNAAARRAHANQIITQSRQIMDDLVIPAAVWQGMTYAQKRNVIAKDPVYLQVYTLYQNLMAAFGLENLS